MNIKEFIEKVIAEVPDEVDEFDVDLGLSVRKEKIFMDSYSSDRVKFKVVRKEE